VKDFFISFSRWGWVSRGWTIHFYLKVEGVGGLGFIYSLFVTFVFSTIICIFLLFSLTLEEGCLMFIVYNLTSIWDQRVH
jgi:hypothetical protein